MIGYHTQLKALHDLHDVIQHKWFHDSITESDVFSSMI